MVGSVKHSVKAGSVCRPSEEGLDYLPGLQRDEHNGWRRPRLPVEASRDLFRLMGEAMLTRPIINRHQLA